MSNTKINKKLQSIMTDVETRERGKRPAPWMDLTKTLEERKQIWDDFWDAMMNPIAGEDFDPESFESFMDSPEFEAGLGTRHLERSEPALPLYTHGIKPKPLRKGQRIGEYESKQDIYLTLAWALNKLWKEFQDYKATHP